MRICYSYYVLDIVHKGHLLQMKNAKAAAGKCGISIVGILTDKAVMEKKKKPILSFDERMELAHSLEYVDFVIAQEKYSPLDNVKSIRPDIVLESNDHDPKVIEKIRRYLGNHGRVIVTPYYPNQSSTKIKNKIRGK